MSRRAANCRRLQGGEVGQKCKPYKAGWFVLSQQLCFCIRKEVQFNPIHCRVLLRPPLQMDQVRESQELKCLSNSAHLTVCPLWVRVKGLNSSKQRSHVVHSLKRASLSKIAHNACTDAENPNLWIHLTCNCKPLDTRHVVHNMSWFAKADLHLSFSAGRSKFQDMQGRCGPLISPHYPYLYPLSPPSKDCILTFRICEWLSHVTCRTLMQDTFPQHRPPHRRWVLLIQKLWTSTCPNIQETYKANAHLCRRLYPH